jgi:hypothetical protein
VDMQAFFHSHHGFASIWQTELVCLHTHQLPVVRSSSHQVVSRAFLPCAGLGYSTFLLKTKKRSSSVDLCFDWLRSAMSRSCPVGLVFSPFARVFHAQPFLCISKLE